AEDREQSRREVLRHHEGRRARAGQRNRALAAPGRARGQTAARRNVERFRPGGRDPERVALRATRNGRTFVAPGLSGPADATLKESRYGSRWRSEELGGDGEPLAAASAQCDPPLRGGARTRTRAGSPPRPRR